MRDKTMRVLGASMGLLLLSGAMAWADEDVKKYMAGSLKSGYVYAAPETRAIQDDDFSNPAILLLDEGLKLWKQVDGKEGKSCESCHKDLAKDMGMVGASYPKYNERVKKMLTVEDQINTCRVDRMGAKELKWESQDLLALTIAVKNQARDKPVKVNVEGPAKEYYDLGKAYYMQRRGQLDLSCAHCHVFYAGNKLRTEVLSEGHPTGFPLYRLKWQGTGSFQRRARGCNEEIRAEPLPYGAKEYLGVELFLMKRAEGLPIETPAVRK